MERKKILPLPQWLENIKTWHGHIPRWVIEDSVDSDIQLLRPNEGLRCWFCHRSAWYLYDWGTIRCAGSGSCGTAYVVDPNLLSSRTEAQPLRCEKCNGLRFKLKHPRLAKCLGCKLEAPTPFPLIILGAILAPSERGDRRVQRQLRPRVDGEGGRRLKPGERGGGPSWQGPRTLEWVEHSDGRIEWIEHVKFPTRRWRPVKW